MKVIQTEQLSNVSSVEIEIESIELNVEPQDKGKTLGCWGPSPDDNYSQC